MIYRIHREGRSIIPIAFCILALAVFLLYYLSGSYLLLGHLGAICALIFFGLIVNFFRDPVRNCSPNENIVIAPCDGKVVVIEEIDETRYFHDRRMQISIFMSPLNVHVNRSPVSGTVKLTNYYPGRYLLAWHPKSSELNEQTLMVVENECATVGFKQIAGGVARRIRWYIKPGDHVNQGQEFGFIKFGSRMDLILPLGTVVKVKLGQKAVGGLTEIADLKPAIAEVAG